MVITNPITGAAISALTVEDVYGLAYKVIEERILGADITLNHPELERSVAEFGAIIGVCRVPAAESSAPTPNATSLPAPAYPVPSVLYFQDWVAKRYRIEWRPIDASKVLSGEMQFEAFTAALLNSLVEGYRNEVNALMTDAFSYQDGATPGTANALVCVDANGALVTAARSVLINTGKYEELSNATFQSVYNRISTVAKYLRKTPRGSSTSKFATAPNGFACGISRLDDMGVYLPIEFTGSAGFEFLSKWNNQREASNLPTVYEDDGLTFTRNGDLYGIALVLDKRIISHVERFRRMKAFEYDSRDSEGMKLLLDDMIPIVTSYKGYAIIFKMPTSDAIPVNVVNTVTVDGEGALV